MNRLAATFPASVAEIDRAESFGGLIPRVTDRLPMPEAKVSMPGALITMHRCVAALVLSGTFAMSAAARTVSFASNRASVSVPDSFAVETSGQTLVATFGTQRDHTVEMTLLSVLTRPDATNDPAIAFVHAQAKRKGAKVSSDGRRAVFSEPGAQFQKDGKVFQTMHWQIGVDHCVFTMTLTAPLPMSPELDEFLGAPLNAIVNGVSCRASG